MHYLLTEQKSTIDMAPMTAAESACFTTGRIPYSAGIAPGQRQSLPGYDSGILSMYIFVIMLFSINARNARSVITRMCKELWSVRRRANLFDDHTAGEKGVTISFVLLACICEATLAATALMTSATGALPQPGILIPVAALTALIFYIFQLTAYHVTGFVFSDKTGKRQWLAGFNASQSLLSIGLLPLALASLFYPSSAMAMVAVGVALYVIARLVFITKGFRIFYTGFNSLLYFILYLCTLEIAPLVLIARICGVYV